MCILPIVSRTTVRASCYSAACWVYCCWWWWWRFVDHTAPRSPIGLFVCMFYSDDSPTNKYLSIQVMVWLYVNGCGRPITTYVYYTIHRILYFIYEYGETNDTTRHDRKLMSSATTTYTHGWRQKYYIATRQPCRRIFIVNKIVSIQSDHSGIRGKSLLPWSSWSNFYRPYTTRGYQHRNNRKMKRNIFMVPTRTHTYGR